MRSLIQHSTQHAAVALRGPFNQRVRLMSCPAAGKRHLRCNQNRRRRDRSNAIRPIGHTAGARLRARRRGRRGRAKGEAHDR